MTFKDLRERTLLETSWRRWTESYVLVRQLGHEKATGLGCL